MQPKTIQTVLTDPSEAQGHLRDAARLAEAKGAHLDVLALGVDAMQTSYYYAGATAVLVHDALTRAQDIARRTAVAARDALADFPTLRSSVESMACQMPDIARVLAIHARFCDLIVLPAPYGSGASEASEAVIEGALFGGMARVIMMPPGVALPKVRRVSLAWNDSPEAFAALRAGLPFMVEADLVKLVIVDPPSHGRDRSDPGGAVSEYLARHKIRVEIDVLSKSLPRVSDVILRHATDADCDLIVMGAYGHSRFREAMLGGATRHMLEQADRPLLLAHS
ncbi:universal stress protein [Roseobacteraceae bacterium S113]